VNSAIETTLLSNIKTVLSDFPEYWNEDTLLKNKVIDDLRNYDEAVITALLSNEKIKETYALPVGDMTIFKVDEFIEMLRYKNYWENSYTKYRNEIGLTSDGKYLNYNTDVVLDFPFKDCILEGGMSNEDEGKKEVYYHNVIAKEEIDTLFSPKVLTNMKKYDKDGEHEITEFNDDDNLIIKGNNLFALHTLKERYAGKVKLIYIDPPYNTGSDSFKYNDKFNHSTWLTFMKNRLEIARKLLSNDGVIYLSIDDKEQAYLKVLMDSIFGKDNFLTQFNFQVRYSDKSLAEAKAFKPVIEYTLMYAKDSNIFKPNQPTELYTDDKFIWRINELSKGKIETINGNQVEIFHKGQWELSKGEPDTNALKETWISGSIYSKMSYGQVYQSIIEPRVEIDGNGALYKIYGRGEDGLGYRYYTNPLKANATRGKMFSGMPLERKREIENGESLKLLPIVNFSDFAADFGNIRHEGGVTLNSGKKPEKMLKLLLEYGSKENDLVLDFFMGSGSTQATALKMNRRFIGMEQIDNQWNKVVERLANVVNGDSTGISSDVNWQGGRSFIYAELNTLNQQYIEKLNEITSKEELATILEEMMSSAYLNFKVELNKVTVEDDDFSTLSIDEKKKVLIDVLDMNQLYLNYSEIEDTQYDISEEVKQFNHSFYNQGGESIG